MTSGQANLPEHMAFNARVPNFALLLNTVWDATSAEKIEEYKNKGRKGAKLFGAALLVSLLSAYSPDALAQPQGLEMVNITTVFVQAMQFTQNHMGEGAQFATDAAAGAVEMAGAVAHRINETIIAPSAGAVRGSGQNVSAWAEQQKEAILSLGSGFTAAVGEVADYLIPETKGAIVERAILIVAALKSFSEGVSFAMKGLRSFGNRCLGRREEEPEATQEAPRVVEVHHHHYYHGTPPSAPPSDDEPPQP